MSAEYRVEKVSPANADYCISTLESFGWQLLDQNEYYNEQTVIDDVSFHEYGGGFLGQSPSARVHSHKDVTNFVMLKFGRDRNMPNYAQIKELNDEYEHRMSYSYPKKPIARTVASVLYVMYLVGYAIGLQWYEYLIVYAGFAILLGFTIWGWVKYKKRCKWYAQNRQRMNQILQEVDKLL